MTMLPTAALPFLLRREHGVVRPGEVTSTEETLFGLLRLYGDELFVQWRTSREISRVGREIRTDRELEPIREVTLPVTGVASAEVRRVWRRWRRRDVLVLTAGDLRAFDALTGLEGVPGLVLEHPAELVLEIRPSDASLARDFASKLSMAISEEMLRALEAHEEPPLLPHTRAEIELPEADFGDEETARQPLHASRHRS